MLFYNYFKTNTHCFVIIISKVCTRLFYTYFRHLDMRVIIISKHCTCFCCIMISNNEFCFFVYITIPKSCSCFCIIASNTWICCTSRVILYLSLFQTIHLFFYNMLRVFYDGPKYAQYIWTYNNNWSERVNVNCAYDCQRIFKQCYQIWGSRWCSHSWNIGGCWLKPTLPLTTFIWHVYNISPSVLWWFNTCKIRLNL